MNFKKLLDKQKLSSPFESGTELPKAIEFSKDALIYSRLSWEVVMRPLYYKHTGAKRRPGEHVYEVPNQFATLRRDTGQYLGVVGTAYKIKQNSEVFEFFDKLTKKFNLHYKFAGYVRGGRMVYLIADGLATIDLGKIGHIDTYLMVTNAHDGRNSVSVITILVHRETLSVICIPPFIGKDRINFRHSIKEIKKADVFIEGIPDMTKKISDILKKASSIKMDLLSMEKYLVTVLERKNVKQITAGDKMRNQILRNYTDGDGQYLLDMYLSSIYWMSHQREYKDNRSKLDNIVIFGRAQRMNWQYLNVVNQMLT